MNIADCVEVFSAIIYTPKPRRWEDWLIEELQRRDIPTSANIAENAYRLATNLLSKTESLSDLRKEEIEAVYRAVGIWKATH